MSISVSSCTEEIKDMTKLYIFDNAEEAKLIYVPFSMRCNKAQLIYHPCNRQELNRTHTYMVEKRATVK